jgi:hypothetical protein
MFTKSEAKYFVTKCAVFVSVLSLIYVYFLNSAITLYNLILQLAYLVIQ